MECGEEGEQNSGEGQKAKSNGVFWEKQEPTCKGLLLWCPNKKVTTDLRLLPCCQ
jgi:hypothetical protein